MTVKELIAQLQKLPPDNEIVADVLGDEWASEVISARKIPNNKAICYISVDRSRVLRVIASAIEYTRDQLLEEPEDEDVW